MALVVKDRVRVSSTTAGTGALTLGAAITGFQDFSVIGNGNTTYYTIVDPTTGDYEIGLGTFSTTGPTLTRNTVLESSNAGAAVNFLANPKDVFVTYPAERSVYVDGANIVPAEAARLGFANLAQGSALSVLGVTGNATANVASVAAASDHQVLRRSGTAVAFGAVALNQANAVTGTLPVARGGTGATTSTGSGAVVLATSPTLVTPALGTPSSGNLANCTFPTLNQNTTGNAATATALQTARTIGGVSFNGTANINLPGVNTAGNQNTTGTSANVTGTVAVSNGGTGQTTYTNGQLLIGNTTGGTLAKATLTAGTGVSITNGAGSISIAATNNGTVTSVGGTGTVNGLTLTGTVTSSGNLTLGGTLAISATQITSGTLAVARGGTGVTTSTGTGNVVLSSSPTLVSPALGTPSSGNLANCTFPTLNQNTTGNAATATALQTARTIGGVSFNGTANINLPGVNTAGNQNTSGNAATATNATNATNVAVTTSNTASAFKVPFANTTASTTGNYGLLQDSTATFTYNPNTNVLTVGTVAAALSGNATTATTLQTARTINGTSFNGSANITTANWGTARTLWGNSVNGSANITAPLRPAAGSVSAPAFSTSGDTNTGIFFPAADTIAITEGGVEVIRVNSSSNVGVGTTTPGEKVDVIGSVRGKQLIASNGIVVNSATVSENYTIPTGSNAMSAGPLTVDAVVTVSAGSTWVVI